MMSTKLATLGLLKIIAFWNKDYDVITSVHYVNKPQVLSYDSNYIVDAVGHKTKSLVILLFLWEKLSQPQFCKPLLDQKNQFFWGVHLAQVQ